MNVYRKEEKIKNVIKIEEILLEISKAQGRLDTLRIFKLTNIHLDIFDTAPASDDDYKDIVKIYKNLYKYYKKYNFLILENNI